MKRLLLLPALLLALTLTLPACRRTPAGVPGREQMAQLVVELHMTDAMVQEQRAMFDSDSVRKLLKQSVLARHGMTQADLNAAFDWYGHHLDEYLLVYERADSIIADSLRALDRAEALAAEALAGDSTDLWPLAPAFEFSRRRPSDYLTFELQRDSTWRHGDVLDWSMRLVNSRSPLSLTIAVEYNDYWHTTEVYDSPQFTVDGPVSVELRLDSTKTASRIYGYAHLAPAEGEQAYVDSIRLIRTRVMPMHYSSSRRMLRRFSQQPRPAVTRTHH